MYEREHFKQAARKAAFKSEDGRSVIHSFRGPMGADWDIEDVLVEIERADLVGWTRGFMGHDLYCSTNDGRSVWFCVTKPAEEAA